MASGAAGGFWGIVAAIVGVAMVTAVLSSTRAGETITAIGGAFGGVLRAAMGR